MEKILSLNCKIFVDMIILAKISISVTIRFFFGGVGTLLDFISNSWIIKLLRNLQDLILPVKPILEIKVV